jgi:hypothetical protein
MIGYLVIGVLFLAIGMSLAILFFYIAQKDIKSMFWPSVIGMVRYSTIEKTPRGFDDEGRQLYTYHPNIIYSYEIDGIPFATADSVFDNIAELEPASLLIARYPVGKQVIVRYNRKEPLKSTIRTNYRGHYIRLGVPTVIMLAGAVLALLHFFNMI